MQYQSILTSVILYLFSEKSFYKRDYLCYYPSTLALYDQSTIVFDCKSKLTSIICVMHEVIVKNKQQQLQSTSSWNYNGQGSLLITQFHKWIIVWISPMYNKIRYTFNIMNGRIKSTYSLFTEHMLIHDDYYTCTKLRLMQHYIAHFTLIIFFQKITSISTLIIHNSLCKC